MQVKDNVLNNNYDLVNTKAFQTMATYNYWRGWWNEPPRNVVEKVVMDLWKDLPINFKKYGGFEYWSRLIEGQTFGDLEWHQDTGEYHYQDNNYWISDKSLIYYPYVSNDCHGGFLEVSNYHKRGTLEDSYKAARRIDHTMVERIRPITNRSVLIDSAQMHRVSPVYKGTRICLATALWKTTPNFFAMDENWTREGVEMKTMPWPHKYDYN
tara:strand:+ start:5803 stop:6435 length:633 start_codon:yes stop_codon:yes gene_type:complete